MRHVSEAKHALTGQKIKAARRHNGLTLDQLADLVGTSRFHLIKLEKGLHAPRAAMVEKLAAATGKTPAFFGTQFGSSEGSDFERILADAAMQMQEALVTALRAVVAAAAAQADVEAAA